jgi:hypothetical protein
MADWKLHQLPEIEYPKNSQRSISAWQRIGYKPCSEAVPVGAVKGEYKSYYAVWDDTQVEPIKSNAARQRREQYHAYLFRRRVYDRHKDQLRLLHAGNADDALMFVSELMETESLWALGVLVVIPQKQHMFDVLVVTDALKDSKPIAPAMLKMERE